MKIILTGFLFISTFSMAQKVYRTVGVFERYDSSVNKIVSKNATAEVIADGFAWSEGPLWVEKYQMLLVSDVPKNTIFKWTEGKGMEVYLTPSGYTGSIKRGGEMGSNGLLLDKNGMLVMCQHGDRRMAKMDAPVNDPQAKFLPIADKFQGKRFNSPNDATYSSKNELFFTDPPYGLPQRTDADSTKETPWNGVYKVNKNGEVVLLIDSLKRPNGVAFFPGGKKLLVSDTDPRKPNWYLYKVDGDKLSGGEIFYSAVGQRGPGGPDGFKIDRHGNVFASGPGGLHIFNKDGKLLGKLKLENPTSNCSMSGDQKTLYITNGPYILRFKMRN
jgi:gluconolactonase